MEKKRALTGIAGILAAVLAASCCWLPLVLVAVGAGGAAVGTAVRALDTFRPIFAVLAIGFLAAAWYFTYFRPRPAARGKSSEECCQLPEERGKPSSAGRLERLNRIFLPFLTALVLGIVFFPHQIFGFLAGAPSPAGPLSTDSLMEVVLEVPGMTCAESCPVRVKSALESIGWVKGVRVDFETKQATLQVDPARYRQEELVAALEKAGFQGSKVRLPRISHATSNGTSLARDTCCPAGTPLLTASATDAIMTKRSTTPNLIGFFSVPSLVCPAAPQIGCGPRAKPLLQRLEREPSISEAWLNGAGTVLAVIGTEDSTRESRAKAVRAVLETKEKAIPPELGGAARQEQLDSFGARDGWYRGAGVDTLSKQEGQIIAQRLVRRVQRKVPLPGEKAKALEERFAEAFDRSITNTADEPLESRLERYNEELIQVARANLDEKGIAAFQEGVAQGYRPLAGEK